MINFYTVFPKWDYVSGVWCKWTTYDKYFLVKGYGASEQYITSFPIVLNRPKCLSHMYLEVVNVIVG